MLRRSGYLRPRLRLLLLCCVLVVVLVAAHSFLVLQPIHEGVPVVAVEEGLGEVAPPAVPPVTAPNSSVPEVFPPIPLPARPHLELVLEATKNVFPGVDAWHFHGRIGLKEDGSMMITMKPDIPLYAESAAEKREHHKGNSFNLRRSDAISVDRHVEDQRDFRCRDISYPVDLPLASIIIVFYNEPLSTLFRSVHSILNLSPPRYLLEIIFVDDCSDVPWLQQELLDIMAAYPKLKLVRLKQRSGLMTARTTGAKHASGEVLLFLDSHIECSPGWLEPMLYRVAQDRRHVVMPRIDSIDADSFEYQKGGLDLLGFTWSLGQTGLARPMHHVDPTPSVIMAGGLFAIERMLFFELGTYDPELQLWGGEEFEISFKIWQCGNTLECVPCSRVAHIFRSDKWWQGQVYKVPHDAIMRNKLRVAEIWMDEYKSIVFDIWAPRKDFNLGNTEQMKKIRRQLGCKDFRWFMDNVYPEKFVPGDATKMIAQGEVRNEHTNACLDTMGAKGQGAAIAPYPCHGLGGRQNFILTNSHELRPSDLDFNFCVDRVGGNTLALWECHSQGGNQFFRWDNSSLLLADEAGQQCV